MDLFSFATMWPTRVVARLVLILACGVALAQNAQHPGLQDDRPTRVSKVFINVTGDTRLSRRLWSFIDFELEDAGIALMNTEDGADMVIDGEVDPPVANHLLLGLGISRVELITNGKTEEIDSCESLSSDENGEVFDQSAKDIAEKMREKYPSARTVKLDSASDMKASDAFRTELPGWLNKSGFSMAESKTADIFLRVDLTKEKVSVEETGFKYEIAAFYRNGSTLFRESGDGVLSARLIDSAPTLCPDRVTDLEWLYSDDPLFRVARNLVRQIRKNNMKVAADPSSGVIKR